jgi:hypothetical protein
LHAEARARSTVRLLQVISHLYEMHGHEVASMLDGFFAFVVLDTRNNTFYAARDHLGITCLYIGWGRDGSVWLSSEMKCLKVRGMRHVCCALSNSFVSQCVLVFRYMLCVCGGGASWALHCLCRFPCLPLTPPAAPPDSHILAPSRVCG